MSREPVRASWSNDQADMLFTFGDYDPEEHYFYYIKKSALLHEKDRAFWISHLSRKSWFTPILREEMMALIEKESK